MISVTISDSDNIGLHNVLSYTRSLLACSDNATYATVTVCLDDNTKAITIHLTKQEDGSITERFTFYKTDI